MATHSDLTAFRLVTSDGESVISSYDYPTGGRTLEQFAGYVEMSALVPGESAEWFVPRTGEVLAECAAGGPVVPRAAR